MILPSDEECRHVLDKLEDEPKLSDWETDFVESNHGRTQFTTAQKQCVARLLLKYDVE
jgi:hypothetical protein